MSNNISNVEFKLTSPDRWNETCQTDWRLCFICKIEKKKTEKLQNPFSKKGKFILSCIILQYLITLDLRACWAAGLKEFWQNFSITSESPEILSWNFHPVNKVFLETFFCQKAPLSNSCTCAKDSFWSIIRLYGLVIWYVKFNS